MIRIPFILCAVLSLVLISLPMVLAIEDQDQDGMDDNWEYEHGLNPSDQDDANEDPDKDGLTNLEEYQWETDPRDMDTDDDGYSDGVEVSH